MLEGVQVAADKARHIGSPDELDIEQPRPSQHHDEAPIPVPLAVRGEKRKVPEVDLGLLARRGLEAHRCLHGAAQAKRAHVVLQHRVAARVALRAKVPQ